MPASYKIDLQADRSYVEIRLSGYWTHSDAQKFGIDLDKALAEMKQRGALYGKMRTLVNLSELSVLSVTVLPVFAAFAANQGRAFERVAAIFGSTLALIQIRRITNGAKQYRFFTSRTEAEQWLDF